ncbi:flavin-containing monooxygenase [Nocardia amamiensis]|uniref:flavin-containing monooxygenase n=1 Tax=Nocardia amamiensis TaxID=404578 RepID=UPI00082FDDD8|nr:NAD(P)/FAD-dependent oxidoreductase [Nocardia amamiensis]
MTVAARVAVIGAGVSGLVTAKVLRDDEFDVVVFEKEAAIGGVWIESRTYPGLRTNNSRDTYAFSDHPYSTSADMFPTAAQVREYLNSYVHRFRLASHLRLSAEVVGLSRQGQVFQVEVRNGSETTTWLFDFVVVCAGVFSEPHVPEIEGMRGFAGRLLHSSRATDPALFEGQRVVVVGAGKSALDLAAWAASHASTCTLVFRKPHWMIPRYLLGRIPSDRLLTTRVNEALFRYHRLNRTEQFLHGPGKTLTRLVWRVMSRLIRLHMRMPAAMVPDKPLPAGIEYVGVAPEFYQMARTGRVLMRRDTIAAFPEGNALLLAGGERIDADVVIFATGWRQPLPFLAPELQASALRDGHFQLYRRILPPIEHRLGFVGYASSPACPLTSEVSAHWLSQSFRGELALPAVDEMRAEVLRVESWLSDALPAMPQGYLLGPFLAHHIDELVADMGLRVRRTRNLMTEYLTPLLPARYSGLAEERRRRTGRGRAP